MPPERAKGGHYPLWVGLIAAGGFTALWLARDPAPQPTPADAQIVDAAPPSSSADPATRPAELIWRLSGATPSSGAEVGRCLRDAGWDRITAHGGGAYPVSVTYSPLILPSLVTPTKAGLELRTPMAARRHQAFALHTAIAACLPGDAIVDPDLGQLTTQEAWPSAARSAGMRVELAVAITPVDGALHARGLGRLGLMDLVLDESDSPIARRRLQQAAAMLLVQDDPGATAMQFGDGEATLTPTEAPGLERARRITLPAGATAVAAPRVAPSTVPAPKAARRPRRARPKTTPKRTPPAKAPPARPKSAAPASRWRPDYL